VYQPERKRGRPELRVAAPLLVDEERGSLPFGPVVESLVNIQAPDEKLRDAMRVASRADVEEARRQLRWQIVCLREHLDELKARRDALAREWSFPPYDDAA
jgi:hypothetical protein